MSEETRLSVFASFFRIDSTDWNAFRIIRCQFPMDDNMNLECI